MGSYLPYFSAAGSVVSMGATLYFWMVRMRQEKPCLRPYLVDREFYLGLSRENERQIGVKLGVVVANHSVLPNAILGARMWLRGKEAWQEVGNVAFDKQTPLPFNLPPVQTVLLRLTGTLSFPFRGDLEEGSKTPTHYLNAFLVQPLEIKLELQALKGRATGEVLTGPGETRRVA
ncbi:MAG: hypothetical protein U0840_13090 [Gemmataceae bacterium]